MSRLAFDVVNIIEKLPVKVESLAVYQERLVVGTSQGSLLFYNVEERHDGSFSSHLINELHSFSKKSVTALEIVEEAGIVLSMSDGGVCVHSLPEFERMDRLPDAKSNKSNLFAVDTEGGKIRLAIARKRELLLYEWRERSRSFAVIKELAIPDSVRTMAWCGSNLCVGFRREYDMIDVESGSLLPLRLTYNTQTSEPLTFKLPNSDELLLGKDQLSIFIDYNGSPARNHMLTWSDVPSALGYEFPYVIGLCSRFVEIRSLSSSKLVQTISLKNSKLVTCVDGAVYIAAQHEVHRLVPVDFANQVMYLREAGEFEEALHLSRLVTDMAPDQKEALILAIRKEYAYDLFCKSKFDKAMKEFLDLDVSVPHVIGLFPGLLPAELRETITYPFHVPRLDGSALDNALHSLIGYLMEVRNNLLSKSATKIPVVSSVAGGSNSAGPSGISRDDDDDYGIAGRDGDGDSGGGEAAAGANDDAANDDGEGEDDAELMMMRQIIDTTLLKAYIQTNEVFAQSLLRLPNYCHVGECEAELKKRKKWTELVLLYNGKAMHREALVLLTRLGQQQTGPKTGVDHTIQYLQHLGAEHIELHLEFSRWILQTNPERGLEIFTAETSEIDSLPQDRVLAHLEGIRDSLATPYLEHIIYNKGADAPEFHNKLVIDYLTRLTDIRRRLGDATLEERAAYPVRTADEAGELGEVRRKLLRFLRASRLYLPEKMVSRFPTNDLFEERAVLLSRIGQHEQALAIYAHKLGDAAMAEAYCEDNYDPSHESSRDVYLALLQVYLRPPNAGEAMIDPALDLLLKYHSRINTPKALELLPPNMPIGSLLGFFEAVVEGNSTKRRENQVMRALLRSENLQVREELIHLREGPVKIDDDLQCRVCFRKFQRNQAFAYYPNGITVHFMCCKDKHVCPVTGEDFRKSQLP